MYATVEIDVSRPMGRRLVRDLEGKKYVNIRYPFIGKSAKTYSHEEVWKMGENILNEHFGTANIKFK